MILSVCPFEFVTELSWISFSERSSEFSTELPCKRQLGMWVSSRENNLLHLLHFWCALFSWTLWIWFFKYLNFAYDLRQILHLYSPSCRWDMPLCWTKSLFLKYVLLHNSHWYGLCNLTCFENAFIERKFLPQVSHLYFFLKQLLKWIFKYSNFANDLRQILHLYSPSCRWDMPLCWTKSLFLKYVLLHNSHWYGLCNLTCFENAFIERKFLPQVSHLYLFLKHLWVCLFKVLALENELLQDSHLNSLRWQWLMWVFRCWTDWLHMSHFLWYFFSW